MQISVFSGMVENIEDFQVRESIQADWQCVGRSTADLIAELGRPKETRSCDIVIAPITITEERSQSIDFVSGVYYTYAIPLSAATNQDDQSDVSFWLQPFEASAWGIILALYVA